jgi:hypothetical protein
MPAGYSAHFGAGDVLGVPQLKKCPNIIEAKTQLAGTPNKSQSANLCFSVETASALCAGNRRQHANSFIKANGLNVDAS